MPFTPFHFGLGYAAAGMEKRPRLFCFFVFVITQVVIDTETLVNMMRGAPRFHTFFHTFLGSPVAGAIAVAISYGLIFLGNWLLNYFPSGLSKFLDDRRLFPIQMPSRLALAVSALIGAWSHVFLDGIMHADVFPFEPFSRANPFEELLSLKWLHGVCVLLFIPGIVLISNRIRSSR